MNQAVFNHFRGVRFSSAHACEEITGIDPDQITASMREMVRRGQLQEVAGCPGLYQYLSLSILAKKPVPDAPAPEPQKKLWWAMSLPHNAPAAFTSFAVAQLAGCSLEYAQRYIKVLLLRKHIQRIGRQGSYARYRKTTTAPAADNAPRVNIDLGG